MMPSAVSTTGLLLTAPNLEVPHGFSTRRGGVSEGVFESLNLGLSTGDDPSRVEANRRQVIEALGSSPAQVCALQQVHGARVVVARRGWYEEKADASVTDDPEVLLVIGMADCLPILLHDPVRHVVGAAHAGWRGSVAGVAEAVVRLMRETYGSDPAHLQVAFGPAIQGRCYQVGPEVRQAFAEAGFPDEVARSDTDGRYRLDIAGANRHALERFGVRPANIVSLNRCTHCEPEVFYSHRRDGPKRGSHWALIQLP